MRIYIAGPISGTEDFEERFTAAAKEINKKGHQSVNPLDLRYVIQTEGIGAIEYAKTIEICKALIDACDAVYMMPGWGSSYGARQEHDEARDKGLRFFASISSIPETSEARRQRLERLREA